jgi:sterol desaturase/sphingolipid hydroxylase (fatty acid hydroxylase superfamily)
MNMTSDLLPLEAYVRSGFFSVVLLGVGFWEYFAPRRRARVGRKIRWLNNLLVHAINAVGLRLVFPLLTLGVAVLCAERGFGLLHAFGVPPELSVVAGVAVLDLAIYGQHVLLHKVGFLWRLHRMHHTDLDVDVTTGVRFHPLEILLSESIKMAVAAAAGVPPVSVLFFEVLLNGMSLFNHGNLRLPGAIDGTLRLFIITPDMHRVHHSIVVEEGNNNYGFSVPWWDRLFGTYRAQPAAGHEGMTIGVRDFFDVRYSRLPEMLATPFLKGKVS